MRFKTFAASLVIGTTGIASAALAIPITSGTLGMSFTYQAEDSAGTNVPLGSATAIDFSPLQAGPPSASNTGSFLVTQATGSFATAGISFNDTGTIHDLIFSPFASVAPFFSIDGVTFNLTSLTVNHQANTDIVLTGSGVFQPGTADTTAGSWSMSAQTDGTNLIGTFTWSADSSPIPEPTTLAILGAGLLGLAATRRMRSS